MDNFQPNPLHTDDASIFSHLRSSSCSLAALSCNERSEFELSCCGRVVRRMAAWLELASDTVVEAASDTVVEAASDNRCGSSERQPL